MLLVLILISGCGEPLEPTSGQGFTFTVVDVGQGLAQIGMQGDSAVLWDIGSEFYCDRWIAEYRRMGKPRVVAVVISHNHEDHYGGLSRLGNDFDWNGRLITSPHEDTAFLRSRAGNWKERIQFEFATWNDTLKLMESVLVRCLWPPQSIDVPVPVSGVNVNRHSMVFSLEYGGTNVLITSDIDSVSQRLISGEFTYQLRSDILIAPHHGSAGSADQLFFGYVGAPLTIVSCGRNNSYGHPSRRMIEELLNVGSDILFTYIDGSVVMRSNGFYWARVGGR